MPSYDSYSHTDGREGSTSRRDVLRSVGALAGVGPLARLGAFDGVGRNSTPPGTGDTTRLLFYNTWLINDVAGIGGAPDRERRVREIGRALSAADYDVAALCEVFAGEARRRIREPLADGGVDARMGPPSDVDKSSGLYTLASGDGPRIVSSHRHVFDTDGAEFRDADAFSNKGALHVELDLGPGNVDLYSTHLLAGGGLGAVGDFIDGIFQPPPPSEYRRRQVRELVGFVRRTRSPENLTVLAGDFNVEADSEEYATLETMMDDLGLYDAWTAHGGRAGGTNRTALEHGCAIDTGDGVPYHCDDSRADHAGAGRRIDYVFLSEPTDDHAVELDVTDLRRTTFWRGLADPGEFFADGDGAVPNYLSDHLGLELAFRVDPATPGRGPPRQDRSAACRGGARCFEGTVGADPGSDHPATRSFTAPVDGTGSLRVRLVTDADADLDLYVTLDGRRPTVDDHDRRSTGAGAGESVVLDPGELADVSTLGIAVRAYAGRAAFTVAVENATPDD